MLPLPSAGVVFGVIAVVVVILVGGALALLFVFPNLGHGGGGATTSSNSTTSSSSSSSTSSSSSSTSSSAPPNCTSASNNCSLQLVQAGAAPVLSSPLTTAESHNLTGDGPCCSLPPQYQNAVNYTDNGNLWTLQGDLEPMGGAWIVGNSSGLSLFYKSCPSTGNLTRCGPFSERGANESYDDPSIYGDLGGIPVCPPTGCSNPRLGSAFGRNYPLTLAPSLTPVPTNATLFAITVNLPYHSYFQSCHRDPSQGNGSAGPGCTYEGGTPTDMASFGFDVGGNYDVVSIAEICPCNSTTNTLQMTAYTSNGGDSIVQTLNSTTVPIYTPIHRLTISTDRKSYISFYVDNITLYSSTTLPIVQNPSYGGVLEFSTRTSINNETNVATFSNVTLYASSKISVSGLQNGMGVVVRGPGGFTAASNANSSGIAVVDVSPEPTNLSVSVELNGSVIATYSSTVNAGAQLKLAP